MGQISLSLPQVGALHATEDVKVGNDLSTIQTLVNGNIDATNLNPASGIPHLIARAASSNVAAAAGDLIRATATLTVTLPSPAANTNAFVGVLNDGSGSAVVTVSSGSAIGFVGGPSTSFQLGTNFSFAVLYCSGSNWYIVSGQQDTGWVNLTLGTGIVVAASATPQIRQRGDRIELSGSAQNTSGGSLAIGTTIFTVGASFTPTRSAIIPIGTKPGLATSLQILASGTTMTNTDSWPNNQIISIEGQAYRLS